jgi:heterodisulfide reductase subunit C
VEDIKVNEPATAVTEEMENTAENMPPTPKPATMTGTPIKPSNKFMNKVMAESGVNLGACYGCKKCSNGCPVTFAMDLHPYQVVRYAQLGLEDKLKECETIWICASCQTCLTRCPNDVDLPRLMDYLKETIAKGNGKAAQERILKFHECFMKEVKTWGRVFEAGLMTRYMIVTGDAFNPSEAIEKAKLGLTMFKKGRLSILPERTKDRKWLKQLFKG